MMHKTNLRLSTDLLKMRLMNTFYEGISITVLFPVPNLHTINAGVWAYLSRAGYHIQLHLSLLLKFIVSHNRKKGLPTKVVQLQVATFVLVQCELSRIKKNSEDYTYLLRSIKETIRQTFQEVAWVSTNTHANNWLLKIITQFAKNTPHLQ